MRIVQESEVRRTYQSRAHAKATLWTASMNIVYIDSMLFAFEEMQHERRLKETE